MTFPSLDMTPLGGPPQELPKISSDGRRQQAQSRWSKASPDSFPFQRLPAELQGMVMKFCDLQSRCQLWTISTTHSSLFRESPKIILRAIIDDLPMGLRKYVATILILKHGSLPSNKSCSANGLPHPVTVRYPSKQRGSTEPYDGSCTCSPRTILELVNTNYLDEVPIGEGLGEVEPLEVLRCTGLLFDEVESWASSIRARMRWNTFQARFYTENDHLYRFLGKVLLLHRLFSLGSGMQNQFPSILAHVRTYVEVGGDVFAGWFHWCVEEYEGSVSEAIRTAHTAFLRKVLEIQ
jgi:hypothetical protein